MKYILILIFLSSCFCSCQTENSMPGYRFSNFKETPVWELAKAIQDDDIEEVKQFCASNKFDLNFEDPHYKMTLLSLTIANDKKEAFEILLNSNINVNFIFGIDKSTNAIIEAISFSENCNSFFVDKLLDKKCSLVKIGVVSKRDNYEENSPLFESVVNVDNNGDFCIDISKKLINKGADINEEYFDSSVNRNVGIIEECLIHNNLTLLEYLVIERKISIPKITLIEGEWGDGKVKKLSLTEALNSVDFDPSYRPKLEESRIKILNYLKQTNQK